MIIFLIILVLFISSCATLPKIDSTSQGRFQVETFKFLDCGIYSPGRLITVLGSFKGLKEGKIGVYWHPWWEPWWYHPWCWP